MTARAADDAASGQDALTRAIAGEQAAVYAYGLAGPHLPEPDQALALGGLAAHRLRVVALRQGAPDGLEPGSPAGYDTGPIQTEAEARDLLGGVEARLAAVYADLAAATTGTARTEAVLAARECAVRSVAWGLPPQAFPGR